MLAWAIWNRLGNLFSGEWYTLYEVNNIIQDYLETHIMAFVKIKKHASRKSVYLLYFSAIMAINT